MAATVLVLGYAVWKLADRIEGIDDIVSMPPEPYRAPRERGIFL